MQPNRRIVEGIEVARIGAGHDCHPRFLEQWQHRRRLSIFAVSLRDLIGSSLGGTIDAPLIRLAQPWADIRQESVLRVILAIEKGEKSLNIESRSDEHVPIT